MIMQLKDYQSYRETHVHYSNLLLPDVFNKLSEGSIVIKFDEHYMHQKMHQKIS